MREGVAQSAARTVAVVLEYKHAMRLAARRGDPPDSDAAWELIAAQCGMKGKNQRDRWAIVKAALAAWGAQLGPQMSLNERLQYDAAADPHLYTLTSVELADRYEVTPAAIRQSARWKAGAGGTGEGETGRRGDFASRSAAGPAD